MNRTVGQTEQMDRQDSKTGRKNIQDGRTDKQNREINKEKIDR